MSVLLFVFVRFERCAGYYCSRSSYIDSHPLKKKWGIVRATMKTMIMRRVALASVRRRHDDATFIFRSMSSSSSSSYHLPSSLMGPPQSLLVPPGQCQFDEEFQSVPLLGKTIVSKTSTVFHFELPDKSQPLNLSTCACILARGNNVQGDSILLDHTHQ